MVFPVANLSDSIDFALLPFPIFTTASVSTAAPRRTHIRKPINVRVSLDINRSTTDVQNTRDKISLRKNCKKQEGNGPIDERALIVMIWEQTRLQIWNQQSQIPWFVHVYCHFGGLWGLSRLKVTLEVTYDPRILNTLCYVPLVLWPLCTLNWKSSMEEEETFIIHWLARRNAHSLVKKFSPTEARHMPYHVFFCLGP